MPNYTENYQIYKPSRNDDMPIDTSLADAMQKIDDTIKSVEDLVGKADEKGISKRVKTIEDEILDGRKKADGTSFEKIGDHIRWVYENAKGNGGGNGGDQTVPQFIFKDSSGQAWEVSIDQTGALTTIKTDKLATVYPPGIVDDLSIKLTAVKDIRILVEDYPVQGAEIDDTARVQRALDNAPEFATVTFRQNKEYNLSNLVITKSLNIDLNGCKITAKPTTNGTDGTPLFWFKGSPVGSSVVINTTAQEDNTITATGDVSYLKEGDFILISDDKFISSWDGSTPSTPGAMGGTGYVGRKEMNMVKSVSGNTITLMTPLEWAYDTNPKVTKISMLEHPKVIGNGALIKEVDPASQYVEVNNDGVMPNLIQFDYCLEPLAQDIRFEGWQLEAIRFALSVQPQALRCSGKNPFRNSFGGHGYLTRYMYCKGGGTSRCYGKNIRHLVDYVQSYDCSSDNNVAINCQYGAYMTHGHGSKRISSVNDIASGCDTGWAFGNGSFNADYHMSIVNPKYVGDGTAITTLANAEGLRIVNPMIKTKSRGVMITTGASDVKIEGGLIYLTSNTLKFESVLVRNKLSNSDPYAGNDPKDIVISNVSFKGRVIIFINNIAGDIVIDNCILESNESGENIVGIYSPSSPDNIRITGNTFKGSFSRGVYSQVSPQKSTIVDNNTTYGHTTAPIYIYAHPNMAFTNNRFMGVSDITFNGDVATAVQNGAYVQGNIPVAINRIKTAGLWNNPLYLGSNALWVDSTAKLRIKNGTPANDTDGTVVGAQV